MAEELEFVFTQKFCDDPHVPHEGCIILQDKAGFFHATETGMPVYPKRYKSVQHFQNGWAWVQKKNGKWKMINKHGTQVRGPTSLTLINK